MKYFRMILFLFLAGVLSGVCGCNAFRQLFSRESGERRQQRSERPRRRSSSSRDRDPVRDMFKIKNRPDYLHDKNLSPRERELLQEQLHSNDPDTWRQNINSSYQEQQKKRHDWVFSR